MGSSLSQTAWVWIAAVSGLLFLIFDASRYFTHQISPVTLRRWSGDSEQEVRSRWFQYDQPAVEALARRHRDAGVPCDVLWLDIDYMDGYRVFTWNRTAFPDVPGMLDRLRESGFRLVTIVDPGVKQDPGYRVFYEGLAGGHFCRTQGGDTYIGQVWPGNRTSSLAQ